MIRFASTPAETSCLISSLFTELRPICGRCDNDNVVLCGITYEGEEQTIILRDYGFDYSGRRETIDAIRGRRCIYGDKTELSAEGKQERQPFANTSGGGRPDRLHVEPYG